MNEAQSLACPYGCDAALEECYGNPSKYSVPPYIASGDPSLKDVLP